MPEETITPTPPWRDVSAEFDEPIEPNKARRKAGLAFEVGSKPLYWDDNGKKREVGAQKAIVREDTKSALAIMGDTYPILQFGEAFGLLDDLVEAKNARYIAAGTFAEGRVGWMLAELPGNIRVGGKDPVAKGVLAMTAHDGSVSTHITPVPIHIGTASLLPGGLRKQDLDINIHHRSNVESRLKESGRLLGTVSKRFEEFRVLADDLFQTKLSDGQMKRVAERVFPGEVGRKLVLARERLVALFGETGVAAGTAWGALVAVCQYLDHERTTRVAGRKTSDTEGTKEREARLASTLYGKSYRAKLDALAFVRTVAKV